MSQCAKQEGYVTSPDRRYQKFCFCFTVELNHDVISKWGKWIGWKVLSPPHVEGVDEDTELQQ